MSLKEEYFNLAKEKLLLFLKDSNQFFVVIGNQIWYDDGTWANLNDFDNNLIQFYKDKVIKIYEVNNIGGYDIFSFIEECINTNQYLKLLWERND